jgi:glycerate dehydrogenase
MTMKIVLLDAFLADDGGKEAWPGLETLGAVTRYDRTPAEDCTARLEGVVVAVTNKVVFDEALLEALPALRHIAVTATGTNVVDLAACRARGIAVTNVPAYSTESVAQHTFALILADACAVAESHARVMNGDWTDCADFCFLPRPTRELAGKALLLIGYGAIGRAVERIARAFGMEVLVAQLPNRPERAGQTPLAEALPRAEVVSLHCPLTAETEGLVGQSFLSRCREDLLLVNTARGGLVDEAALATWLSAHPQARAAVDVLSSEPPRAESPLLNHAQVTVTPHIAWATVEARDRLRTVVVENIAAWQAGTEQNRVDLW